MIYIFKKNKKMNFRPNNLLKKSVKKSRNNHLRVSSNPIELSHTYINQFNNTFNPNKGQNSPIFKTIKSYASIKLKNDKNIENLLSNYLYISPNVDSNKNITNFENFMSKTKKNFYNQQKSEISKFLNQTKKSTTIELNDETLPHIYMDNINYKNPIDSLGSLIQNRNIYDNILKDYNLKTLNTYSKKIEKYSTDIHKRKLKQKIKISSLLPQSIEKENNTLFKDLRRRSSIKKSFSLNKISNKEEEEKEKKKSEKKIIAIPSISYEKKSLFLLCKNIYQKNTFPECREQFSMDIEKNKNEIFLFGGLNSNMKNSNLWKFYPNELKWQKIKSSNSIEPRLGHTGILYENRFIIFGGRYYNSNDFACLDIYNTETNNWFYHLEKPFFPLRRNHISCMIGSHMFIHGGISDKGEYLNDSYILNLNPIRWSSLIFSKYTIHPKLAYHSCALVVSSDIRESIKFNIYHFPDNVNLKRIQNKIQIKGVYIFGGKNKEDNQPSNKLFVLIIGKKPLEWIQLETKGQPPSPRYMSSMNYFEEGNYLIIHGGRNDYSINMVMKDTFVIEMSKLEWLRVDFGKNFSIVKNRCSHQSVISGKTLFIFGGMDDKNYVGSALFVVNLDPGVAGNVIQKAVSIFGFEFGGNFVNGLNKALKKIIMRKREEKRIKEEMERKNREFGEVYYMENTGFGIENKGKKRRNRKSVLNG